MMKKNEFVTSYGFFATVIVTVIGVGIFSYPRELANVVGTDGWIITLIMGLISYFILRIIWKTVKVNNYKHLTSIAKDNLGSILGSIAILIFAAGNILAVSMGMRTFVEVIKMNLLDKTPTEFILIITILAGVYLIRGELSAIIRFNEIALWVMFIPMIIILLLATRLADFSNILPILHNPPVKYLQSIRYTAVTFGGLEIAFLVIPLINNREKGIKSIKKSVIFITVFYVIITVMTLAVFSREQVKILLWPTMAMVKSINVPGAFIERWEGIVMALWVIFYYTTFVNSYYFSSMILKEVFSLGDVKISSLIIIPFIYVIAMFPDNVAEVYRMNIDYVPWSEAFNLIVLPLLLLVTTRSKNAYRREEKIK